MQHVLVRRICNILQWSDRNKDIWLRASVFMLLFVALLLYFVGSVCQYDELVEEEKPIRLYPPQTVLRGGGGGILFSRCPFVCPLRFCFCFLSC